jgi:hypothetical protein
MANNFFHYFNFNCTSGSDVQKPRSTILKRGRTIIKKRFESKKIIVKCDLPRTKGILKSHIPRTKGILKNQIKKEQGNSVWFDLSDAVDFNSQDIPKDNIKPKLAIDEEMDTTRNLSLENVIENGNADVTLHSLEGEHVPNVIDTTLKLHNGHVHNSNNITSHVFNVYVDNEIMHKITNVTFQPTKEKFLPKIVDLTPKLHNDETDKTDKTDKTDESKNLISQSTCKLEVPNLKNSCNAADKNQPNSLLDNITGIESADKDVYSINVSNSRFFVPNNYVFTNYKNSMNDLSFKVDPEMTKALRKSLEEKTKNSTDIIETPSLSNSIDKSIDKSTSTVTQSSNHLDSSDVNVESKPCIQTPQNINLKALAIEDTELSLVQLRKPLLCDSIKKDIPLNKEAADDTYKVELRKPLARELVKNEITLDKIKRPLTASLQLSRSNFLRNSIHEIQPPNLSLKRY